MSGAAPTAPEAGALTDLAAALEPHGLRIVGGFHPGPDDPVPEPAATVLLVGADGGRMWTVFEAAPEASDGAPHPLDRWSRRVLDSVAAELGARAAYPFGGPPYQPFIRWSARGEGLASSPVGLPVSPSRGLWASFRGALLLSARVELGPPPAPTPCTGCPAPCRTACPVGAMGDGSPEGYDVAACTAHILSDAGAACRSGCLVRAACPVGAAPPEPQRQFHMAAFVSARQQRG